MGRRAGQISSSSGVAEIRSRARIPFGFFLSCFFFFFRSQYKEKRQQCPLGKTTLQVSFCSPGSGSVMSVLTSQIQVYFHKQDNQSQAHKLQKSKCLVVTHSIVPGTQQGPQTCTPNMSTHTWAAAKAILPRADFKRIQYFSLGIE